MACCEVLTHESYPATVDPNDLQLHTVRVCFSTTSHALYEAARPPTPYRDRSPSLPSNLIRDNLLSFDEPLAVRQSITPGPPFRVDGDDLEMIALDQLPNVTEDPGEIADDWEAYINMSSPNSSPAIKSTSQLEGATGNDAGERPPTHVSEVVVEKVPSANSEQSTTGRIATLATAALFEKFGLNEDFLDDTPSPQSNPVHDGSPPIQPIRASSTADLEQGPKSAFINYDDYCPYYTDDYDPWFPDIGEGQSRKRPIVIPDDEDSPPVKKRCFPKLGSGEIRRDPDIDIWDADIWDEEFEYLRRRGRNPQATLLKTSNTASSAMISLRETSEKPRNAIDAVGQIATTNTVTVAEQEIRKSIIIYLKNMQLRQERLEPHLRSSLRRLCKRPHKKSHKDFIEDLQNSNWKTEKDLEGVRDCMASLGWLPI